MEKYIIQAIEAEKKSYDEEYKFTKNYETELNLPISKLHGISVDATIDIRCTNYRQPVADWKYWWLLEIKSDELYNDYEEDEFYRFYCDNTSKNERKEDDIAGLTEELERLIKSVKDLQFDKGSGVFKRQNEEEKMTPIMEASNKAFEILKDDENIETNCQTCTVCYELTRTRTSCGHCVCIPCITKIKRHPEDEGAYRCPLCRDECTGLK